MSRSKAGPGSISVPHPNLDLFHGQGLDLDLFQGQRLDLDPCQGQEPDLDPYQSQEPDRDPYQSQEPDLDLFLCQQPDLDPYQGITCIIMRAGEGGRLRHTHMKLLALNNNKMNIKCGLVLLTYN